MRHKYFEPEPRIRHQDIVHQLDLGPDEPVLLDLWAICGEWFLPPEHVANAKISAYVTSPATCLWCAAGLKKRLL